jgi:hypothetical protein
MEHSNKGIFFLINFLNNSYSVVPVDYKAKMIVAADI